MSTQQGRKLPYKPRLSRAKRQKLIEKAAEELFAQRGYADTSLEDIAVAAGISRPVIYDYYPTKRVLYEELGARHMRAMMQHMITRAAESDGTPESQFVAATSGFYEFLEANPYSWRITVDAVSHTGGITDAEVHSDLSAGVAGFFTQAFETAGKSVDQERIVRYAETMRWALPGLAAWWWHNRDVPRSEIAKAIHDLFWTGLDQMMRADSE